MPTKEEIKAQMNTAADAVFPQFTQIKEKYPEAVAVVAKFLNENYLQVGYNRLAKMIMGKDYKKER